MALTDIFTESFNTVWKNPKVVLPYLILDLAATILIAVFALVVVLPAVSHAAAASAMTALRSFGTSFIAIIAVSFVIGIFVTPLFYGVYTNLELQKLRRQKVSLSSAYAAAKGRYSQLFWGGIATMLMYAVVAVVFVAFLIAFVLANSGTLSSAVVSASSSLVEPVLGIIGFLLLWFILLFLCLVVLAIFLFQWVPVLMIEKKGAIASIRRSIEIGKRQFWTLLGTFFIYAILTGVAYGIVVLLSLPFGLAGHGPRLVAQLLLEGLLGGIIGPWYIFLMTSFYNSYVKRIR